MRGTPRGILFTFRATALYDESVSVVRRVCGSTSPHVSSSVRSQPSPAVGSSPPPQVAPPSAGASSHVPESVDARRSAADGRPQNGGAAWWPSRATSGVFGMLSHQMALSASDGALSSVSTVTSGPSVVDMLR